MFGCIKFSNGEVLWFNSDNLHEVVAKLTDKQKRQVAELLKERLGPEPDNEFGVDDDVHHAWHESVHRKDIKRGGGSSNGESKPNKGTKKLPKHWDKKSEPDKNLTWLVSIGFRRRWDKDRGYVYRRHGLWIPNDWIQNLLHDEFKERIDSVL